MSRTDILYHLHNNKEIVLSHQCMTENGFEKSDVFTIVDVIGDYEQIKIRNQYKQSFVINPKQVIS